MATKFTLEIELSGDDDFHHDIDVEIALLKVVGKIRDGEFNVGHTESLLDVNGNRIGSWKFHA